MTIKEVKKERKRKKIFLAIIMILFTGIILTASTYAWFTANRTVTVESIDVNVSTSQGLQISTDASNWKSIVTNDDINNAITTYPAAINQLPAGPVNTAVPVSTVGTVTTGMMEMFKGLVEGDESTGVNYLSSTRSIEKNGNAGDFVAFDLFFQSTEEQPIYLTSNSNVVAKGTSTGIENAARVAFIKEGEVGYGSAASDAQSLKGNSAMLIWEPNQNRHTQSGIDNARNTYGLTIAENNTKLAYKGVKAEFTTADKVVLNSTDANKFGDVTTVGSLDTGIPTNKYQQVFTIGEGITKVRIYMWIEGQDVDCEDHASGGAISYNLQFSIDDKA